MKYDYKEPMEEQKKDNKISKFLINIICGSVGLAIVWAAAVFLLTLGEYV